MEPSFSTSPFVNKNLFTRIAKHNLNSNFFAGIIVTVMFYLVVAVISPTVAKHNSMFFVIPMLVLFSCFILWQIDYRKQLRRALFSNDIAYGFEKIVYIFPLASKKTQAKLMKRMFWLLGDLIARINSPRNLGLYISDPKRYFKRVILRFEGIEKYIELEAYQKGGKASEENILNHISDNKYYKNDIKEYLQITFGSCKNYRQFKKKFDKIESEINFLKYHLISGEWLKDFILGEIRTRYVVSLLHEKSEKFEGRIASVVEKADAALDNKIFQTLLSDIDIYKDVSKEWKINALVLKFKIQYFDLFLPVYQASRDNKLLAKKLFEIDMLN